MDAVAAAHLDRSRDIAAVLAPLTGNTRVSTNAGASRGLQQHVRLANLKHLGVAAAGPAAATGERPSFRAVGGPGACKRRRMLSINAITRAPGPARALCHGTSRAEWSARTTASASGDRQRRLMSRGGPAHLRKSRFERRRERVRRRSSGQHERGSGRRLSQAGPAPESGGGIGAWFSEIGIDSLVRPGGWRRLRRFAGSTGASNVAFRGMTPDPAPAIQAGTGSGVDAGPVGGTRSINSKLPERRPSSRSGPTASTARQPRRRRK